MPFCAFGACCENCEHETKPTSRRTWASEFHGNADSPRLLIVLHLVLGVDDVFVFLARVRNGAAVSLGFGLKVTSTCGVPRGCCPSLLLAIASLPMFS
jgi:hypothetical protein